MKRTACRLFGFPRHPPGATHDGHTTTRSQLSIVSRILLSNLSASAQPNSATPMPPARASHRNNHPSRIVF